MIPGIYELLDYGVNQIGQYNMQIVWSYQNAPRVGKPYIMIDYTDNDLPNFECVDPYIDANGMQDVGSWRRATVSLQFYCGPGSDRVASKVAMILNGNACVDKQVALDVAIGNRLMFQRIPALLNNSQYEDRIIYQFDYYYTDHFKDDVGFIQTVEVTGGYEGDILNPPDDPDVKNWPIRCEETIEVPYVIPTGDNRNG